MKIKMFLTKNKYFLWLLFFVLCCAFDVRLKVVTYTIQSDKVNAPIRLCLVTDLHGCYYGEGQKNLIAQINKMEPDVILLGGDIFDDRQPWEHSEVFVAGITQYPSYYVTGNHEYWTNQVDEILDILQSYGVDIIDGEHTLLEINGQFINLSGISDPDGELFQEQQETSRAQLNDLEGQINQDFFSILLTHRPELADTYQDYSYDLALAGHAHGGQWRIPFLINGVYAPNQGLFPDYAGGFYDLEHVNLIVSRGLARESTSIPRIFNRPELVFIDIHG